MSEIWELVEYDCQDGECLVIHNKKHDRKLGALSLSHRSIGEAIVEELNKLEKEKEIIHIKDMTQFIEDMERVLWMASSVERKSINEYESLKRLEIYVNITQELLGRAE